MKQNLCYIPLRWLVKDAMFRTNSLLHVLYNWAVYINIPGTQMNLVLNGKGLLLEGSNPKIEDKQVPGIYINIYNRIFEPNNHMAN